MKSFIKIALAVIVMAIVIYRILDSAATPVENSRPVMVQKTKPTQQVQKTITQASPEVIKLEVSINPTLP